MYLCLGTTQGGLGGFFLEAVWGVRRLVLGAFGADRLVADRSGDGRAAHRRYVDFDFQWPGGMCVALE